jgi:hypothetical protein
LGDDETFNLVKLSERLVGSVFIVVSRSCLESLKHCAPVKMPPTKDNKVHHLRGVQSQGMQAVMAGFAENLQIDVVIFPRLRALLIPSVMDVDGSRRRSTLFALPAARPENFSPSFLPTDVLEQV